MIEELRSIARPGLQEALRWVGYRVDDIYGANVGKLEDVWVDPRGGEPRWLLVRTGRFGGHHTLIPFDDATAGAGHIWIPFERDAVRHAPEVSPGEPLDRELDARLKEHYNAARAGTGQPAAAAPTPAPRRAEPSPAPAPVAPVPLARVRAQRRRNAARGPLDELAVDVEDAVVRLEGIGELDGRPVQVELEGRFTGTIRPRTQVRRSGRPARV